MYLYIYMYLYVYINSYIPIYMYIPMLKKGNGCFGLLYTKITIHYNKQDGKMYSMVVVV